MTDDDITLVVTDAGRMVLRLQDELETSENFLCAALDRLKEVETKLDAAANFTRFRDVNLQLARACDDADTSDLFLVATLDRLREVEAQRDDLRVLTEKIIKLINNEGTLHEVIALIERSGS